MVLVSFAQPTILPNKTAAYLAARLVATSGTVGVLVSNETLTFDSNANAEFNGVSNLGIADGIALGTGNVASNALSATIGLDGLPSSLASTYNFAPGDTQLANIAGGVYFDACILAFDLQPAGSFVEFEYIFGSEEYPEFNCSAFNDIFGFFISGSGFSSPTNIALIPTTSTPVSINTINDGSNPGCPSNTALYVNNTDTVCTMDGFTVPLIAHANVTPGASYHLKLAISDISDGILNSYVILKANSLKSGGDAPNLITALDEQELICYPSPMSDQLYIRNTGKQDLEVEMMDLYYRQLFNMTCSSDQPLVNIAVDKLPKGLYVLKIKNIKSNQVFIRKMIKNLYSPAGNRKKLSSDAPVSFVRKKDNYSAGIMHCVMRNITGGNRFSFPFFNWFHKINHLVARAIVQA